MIVVMLCSRCSMTLFIMICLLFSFVSAFNDFSMIRKSSASGLPPISFHVVPMRSHRLGRLRGFSLRKESCNLCFRVSIKSYSGLYASYWGIISLIFAIVCSISDKSIGWMILIYPFFTWAFPSGIIANGLSFRLWIWNVALTLVIQKSL